MIASTDYPDLQNFIECTFHQDWDETPGTYKAVVDTALTPEPADHVRRIAADGAALLSSPATDQDVAAWLTRIGCYAILEEEGYTPRSFIAMIGERIRARG
jgi:hypothetical protein